MGFVDLEHVKSPLWGPFRRAVIEVQGSKCVLCGEEAPFPYIQPRNIYYTQGRLPWDYEIDEMQVVCRSCYYGALDGTKNVLARLREFSQDEQIQILGALRNVYNAEGARSTGMARGILQFVESQLPPPSPDEPDLDYMTRRAETGMLSLPRETHAVVLQSLALLRKIPARQRAQILAEL